MCGVVRGSGGWRGFLSTREASGTLRIQIHALNSRDKSRSFCENYFITVLFTASPLYFFLNKNFKNSEGKIFTHTYFLYSFIPIYKHYQSTIKIKYTLWLWSHGGVDIKDVDRKANQFYSSSVFATNQHTDLRGGKNKQQARNFLQHLDNIKPRFIFFISYINDVCNFT